MSFNARAAPFKGVLRGPLNGRGRSSDDRSLPLHHDVPFALTTLSLRLKEAAGSFNGRFVLFNGGCCVLYRPLVFL